jgi:hypothetical protein
MPTQSDYWLPVSKALARLDAGAAAAAHDIIARGEVRVRALRGDFPGSTTPVQVERLLAQATRADIVGDDITAHYEPGQDIKSILGPRSDMRNKNVVAWIYGKAACSVTFRDASVYWPALAEALAAAGFWVKKRRTGPKRETKIAAVQRYIASNYPTGIPAGVTDKAIARDTGVSERTVRRVRSGKS